MKHRIGNWARGEFARLAPGAVALVAAACSIEATIPTGSAPGAVSNGADADGGAAVAAGASGSDGAAPDGATFGTTPAVNTLCGAQITDIVDSSLHVVPAAYTAMAAQMSKDAGIAYRFGPDAVSCGTANTGPALFQPTSTKLVAPAWDVPFYWSVGGPPSADPRAYSSSWGNLIFAADDDKARVGVTDLQVTSTMFNVFAELPQLSWTRASVDGGGLDAITVMAYRDRGVASGDPIATGRCEGQPGFCSEAVVAFQNGVVGTVGSNTASNRTTTLLAPNKVPTSIAMTNDSEFALVTVWDTQALKGQVAVVALAGLCDNCDPFDSSDHTRDGVGYAAWYDWWHEWNGVYPGLPNMGNIAFMKVLGYVDLPGITAPTEIAVTTGMEQFKSLIDSGPNFGQFVGRENSPLTSTWQSFAEGGANYYKYAKGGVAVVISKSEQKAAFIDLKPLFDYVNGMYFGSHVDETSNLGTAANQWPYTFDQVATQMPTVIKTVSLAERPTAVKTTVYGKTPRAWIATQDGTLHVFSLDGFAPGNGFNKVANPDPNAIKEVGTVTGIGRNPTSLATSKGEPDRSFDGDTLNGQVLVGSRGDNKISWVRFDATGNSGTVVRAIQHNELTDLIAVEDADNFANVGFVVTALDYSGKAVRNYRYGAVTFTDGGACAAPNGCPIGGNGAAEYGGALLLPGKPFKMSTTNTP